MRRDARSFVGAMVSKLFGKLPGSLKGGTTKGGFAGHFFEPLEPRKMVTASVALPMNDITVNTTTTTSRVVSVANLFKDDSIFGTVVEFTFLNVNAAPTKVNVELFDGVTVQTVANFLKYVTNNKWDDTIIHRAVYDFVVQGGAFKGFDGGITTYAPVINEPYYSNKRGTIAMAKVSGNPNSATNQWFFNVEDNSKNLDYQNGGFTVFGRVLGDGMTTIDKINDIQSWNAGGAFTSIPLVNYTSGAVQPNNFVRVQDISVRKEVVVTSATSSNNSIVTTSFDESGNLKLNFVGDLTGKVNITVTGTSADGTTATDTFTIDVVGTGVSPTANSGTINIDFARSTNITSQLFGLTSGGLRETLTILTKPTHGSLAFDSQNQQVYYVADAGYVGTDSFKYTLRNGANYVSDIGTVNLENASVVTLGGGSGDIQEVVYKNSAGKTLSIKFQSGTSGKVHFSGSPTALTLYGSLAVLEGTNLDVDFLDITSSTSTTSATSSNTGLVTTSVGANGATLAFSAGVFGTSTITVNGVTADGAKTGKYVVTVLNNTGPTAGNGTFISEFNRVTNITQQVFALTSDPDGTINKSTFRVVQQPAHGTVFFDSDTQQIVYQPDPAYTGSDTFTYTVLDDKNVVSNAGTITMTTGKVITLSSAPGGIRQLTFMNSDGARVVFTLQGVGTVKLEFTGSINSFTTYATTGLIVGTSPVISSVLISGTNSSSVITVTSEGGSAEANTTITGVTLTSDLGAFYAPSVSLGAGGFVASAGSDIGVLRVADIAANADITLPGTNPGMQVIVRNIATAVDMNINSMAQSVRARQWGSGNLNALGLESFLLTSTAASGMKLTTGTESQTLRWVMFGGGLGGTGSASIAGGVGQMLVLGATASGSSITIGKDVQKFVAVQSLGGSTTISGSVNTFKVLGSISQGTLNFATVGSMVVGGNLVDTTVKVSVGIQNLLASQMINSSLLSGVSAVSAGTLLPTAAGQFTAQPGYIGFVGLSGSATPAGAGFQDSRIAGKTLINARLGYVKTSNASEGFGIAALNYTGLIRMTVLESDKTATIDTPANQAAANGQFSAQGIAKGDFVLLVVGG